MNLFETIQRVHPGLPGWCSPEKAECLAAMVVALRPKVSVEIGVFGGSSFIPIALAHQHIDAGVVWGIDPWNKADSVRNEAPEHAEWWSNIDHDAIYTQFMGKLRDLGLTRVTIIRKCSDAVVPPEQIDLLHVDGSHTDQAQRDVSRFAAQVRLGGLCVMDDINWVGGHVTKAVQQLKTMRFCELYPLGTGAVYQRI